MTSTSAEVVLKLKQEQTAQQSRKLSHQEVRKLLKKERRRSKRTEAAVRSKNDGPHDGHESGDESEDEEYLRSKNLWLMREKRFTTSQEREAKRLSAEQMAKAITARRGWDQR